MRLSMVSLAMKKTKGALGSCDPRTPGGGWPTKSRTSSQTAVGAQYLQSQTLRQN
jgi:hypothetical protein